jgi:hypothetical protein
MNYLIIFFINFFINFLRCFFSMKARGHLIRYEHSICSHLFLLCQAGTTQFLNIRRLTFLIPTLIAYFILNILNLWKIKYIYLKYSM